MTPIFKSRSIGPTALYSPQKPLPIRIGFDQAKPGSDRTQLLIVGGGRTVLSLIVNQYKDAQ